MDAFAVSICIGITNKNITVRDILKVSSSFGFFQAFMPIIGWYVSSTFGKYIETIDHWVAFGLLTFIGTKMIYEALKNQSKKVEKSKTNFLTILTLAIATSIDALAIGVAFAILNQNIFFPALIIGVVTFIFSFAGVKGGDLFGKAFRKGAEIIGGLILIIIGVRILIEHLFLL
ncbi:MAG: manganese efflux pump [Kosmotoga sp.]|nr:MAG: manganese efflux pump [Kosmotoga sp.]